MRAIGLGLFAEERCARRDDDKGLQEYDSAWIWSFHGALERIGCSEGDGFFLPEFDNIASGLRRSVSAHSTRRGSDCCSPKPDGGGSTWESTRAQSRG
jgi:hypothetical protein